MPSSWGTPLQAEPDGYCFFDAVANGLFGTPSMKHNVILRTMLELRHHEEFYSSLPELVHLLSFCSHETESVVQFTLRVLDKSFYSSPLTIFATAGAMDCTIRSIWPPSVDQEHGIPMVINSEFNPLRGFENLRHNNWCAVVWTSSTGSLIPKGTSRWEPNHFVPLKGAGRMEWVSADAMGILKRFFEPVAPLSSEYFGFRFAQRVI